MNIQGILFDLDGTLADTIPMCIKAYKYTFQHFLGRDFSDDEITALFGLSEEGIIQRVIPDQWDDALQFYHETYKRLHNECSAPFADIETALKLLKQRGVSLAVVTGKGIYTALLTLDYLGLAPYFDMVEAGEANEIVKAQRIRKILAIWGISPQNAAYIGDADSDMQEAQVAEVLPLATCWSATATIHRLTSMTPFATFNTVKDFIGWLDSNIEVPTRYLS